MDDTDAIWYDEEADVLYITLEDAEGIVHHHGPNILVRRSPDDGRVVGITMEDVQPTLDFEESGQSEKSDYDSEEEIPEEALKPRYRGKGPQEIRREILGH